jgi:cobalt-zinc-cadmium efflux system outer membrane protein
MQLERRLSLHYATHDESSRRCQVAPSKPDDGKDAAMKTLHVQSPAIALGLTVGLAAVRMLAAEPATVSHAIPSGSRLDSSGLAQADALRPEVETLAQPSGVAAVAPEEVPPHEAGVLAIEDLVGLALTGNPAVAQSVARVAALRGRWVQAGLPPNPTAGYLASEVGNDGSGGQQGGFAGQEFVTGGKLQLDQAVVAQQIQQAELQLSAAQLRVMTDVRRAAYAVLLAQRRVELAAELVNLSGQAVQASRELQEAQEISRAGLLQTQLEQQTTSIVLRTAQNELSAAWRNLYAVVGSEFPATRIAGDVTRLPTALDWDEQLARISAASPELGAAMADVSRAQMALRRAVAEPIPNLETQFSVQYDESSNDAIAGVQVGVPLPLWNRNQGGIRQSQAEIVEARRNADRIQLDLKRRLAEAFQRYATAHAQAEIYSASILPQARESFELVQRGYSLGEVGYLDLLTAQRTYFQVNLAYLDALSALWASWTEIDGLLLSGSLAVPPNE